MEPHSLVGGMGGKVVSQVGAWPAASKTNASWPAHRLGRAGRYGPFNVWAAGQVSSETYSLPPHNPTREGSPEGRTSSLWGSFPHFFPRNGAPAGQAKVPCRSNGVGKKPQRPPPGRANSPTRSNSAGNSPFPPPPGYGILR